MNVSLPQQNVLLAGVALAALGAYAWFLYLPTSAAIAQSRTEIGMQRQFVEKARTLDASLAAAETSLTEVRQYSHAQRAALPAADSLASLLAEITRGARRAGVHIVRFEPQGRIALESIERAPLLLGIEGPFAAVHDFLQQLESLPAPIWIDDLHLDRPSADAARLHAELRLTIFADRSGNSD